MKESGEVYRQPRRQASVFPLYDIDNIGPGCLAPQRPDVDARLPRHRADAEKFSPGETPKRGGHFKWTHFHFINKHRVNARRPFLTFPVDTLLKPRGKQYIIDNSCILKCFGLYQGRVRWQFVCVRSDVKRQRAESTVHFCLYLLLCRVVIPRWGMQSGARRHGEKIPNAIVSFWANVK